jgi:hypothetical protein
MPPERSANRLAIARQASSTAPPDIIVCLEAELEPADPTPVSDGRRTTSSTPRIVLAIWAMTVWTPCPTSAAAL